MKKAATKAQIIPATLTACLVGVTEPLEFTFLFAAPALWLVYSVLDGLFQMIVYLVGIRVCATNGIIDFLVLNLPAGIGRTPLAAVCAGGSGGDRGDVPRFPLPHREDEPQDPRP